MRWRIDVGFVKTTRVWFTLYTFSYTSRRIPTLRRGCLQTNTMYLRTSSPLSWYLTPVIEEDRIRNICKAFCTLTLKLELLQLQGRKLIVWLSPAGQSIYHGFLVAETWIVKFTPSLGASGANCQSGQGSAGWSTTFWTAVTVEMLRGAYTFGMLQFDERPVFGHPDRWSNSEDASISFPHRGMVHFFRPNCCPYTNTVTSRIGHPFLVLYKFPLPWIPPGFVFLIRFWFWLIHMFLLIRFPRR